MFWRRGTLIIVTITLALVPAFSASAQVVNTALIQQQIALLLEQVHLLQLQLAALQQSTGLAPQTVATSGPTYNVYSLAHSIQDEVNTERRRRGLSEVAWNETLALVARLHSEDQATDNQVITNANKPCTYPLLRHEGTTHGLTVLDRVERLLRNFRAVGENIVTFPLTTNGSYTYSRISGPVKCPNIEAFEPEDYSTPQRRLDAFYNAKEEREEELEDVRTVTWVTQDWRDVDDIAERAVDLWLDSPGHRENMLNSRYDEAGVGIARVNNYLIITQVFLEER